MFKRFPFIYQTKQNSCGIACIRMILAYYGVMVHDYEIEQQMTLKKTGISIEQMIQTLTVYQVKCRALKGSYEELLQLFKQPMIAHVVINGQMHYVVIYKMSKKRIVFADPSTRLLNMKQSGFMEIWTGIVIETDGDACVRSKSHKFIGFILDIILKEYKIILTTFLLSSLVVLLQIIVTNYQTMIMDDLTQFQSLKPYLEMFLSISLLFSSGQIIQWIKGSLMMDLYKQFDDDYFLHAKLAHIKKRASFFDKNHVGDFMFWHDYLDRLKQFILSLIGVISVDLLTFAALCIILFMTDAYLSLILLVLLSLQMLVVRVAHKSLKHKQMKMMPLESSYQLRLHQSYEGATTLGYSGGQMYLSQKLKQSFSQLQEAYIKLGLFGLGLSQVKQWVQGMATLVLIAILYYDLILGKRTIGHIIFVLLLNQMMMMHLNAILGLKDGLEGAKKGHEVYMLLLETKSHQSFKLPSIKCIELNQVFFTYNQGEPVLSNLNMVIDGHVLFNAPSGKGKTTLMKLLLQEVKPQKGYILFNEVDYLNYDEGSITSKIGYIQSTGYLFKGSIKDNILLGSNQIQRLYQLIRFFKLEALFIKGPLDLDYVLHQSGQELSNGQKQLIHLLRFLMHSYDVLILDEATSMLDQSFEQTIIAGLLRLYHNKIIIIISHRYKHLDGFKTQSLEASYA